MTNKEAIERINLTLDAFKGRTLDSEQVKDIEALEIAIKSLEQTEGDLISREAVNNLQRYRYGCGEASIVCVSLNSINNLSTIIEADKTESEVNE